MKRGGGAEPVTLDNFTAVALAPDLDTLDLDRALTALAQTDEDSARVVESLARIERMKGNSEKGCEYIRSMGMALRQLDPATAFKDSNREEMARMQNEAKSFS